MRQGTKFCTVSRNPLDARISHQRRGPQSAEPAAGTLTIALFLLNLRRTSERAGRFAERHQASETTPDIRRQMLDAASRRPADRDALVERMRDGKF